ncbi:hypothetical protein AB1Y20_008981 [Prymnesium parvum]|uniref:Prolyl 4-hydroxylase alpha subunit domain-containing protein n=1 Tax=Prymnesium parvum TaxID=97485 RepID=A0AB34JZ26_PRYPA|mmetsp:Transcript_38752/g.88955  ORF Transcript_38752/g.88955 Transcript_38752/m.88955 type:complete len:271 (+) Transcript_38752:2-814(+)
MAAMVLLLVSLSDGALLGHRCGLAAIPGKEIATRRASVQLGSGFASAKGKKSGRKTDSLPQRATPPSPAAEATRYELPAGTQFMGGWLIPPQICDDLVSVFESSPSAQTRGMISMRGGDAPVVDKSVKDSVEMSFAPNDPRPEWKAYLGALGRVMASYVEEYPMAGAYGQFGLISRTNFQYYPPGGGYKTFHTERTGAGEPEGSRHLVFMTYLNDVTDAGGTEFYHQNVTLQPVKGLTLVWPSDWTFTHRGVPSPTQEKRIITGWFNFVG